MRIFLKKVVGNRYTFSKLQWNTPDYLNGAFAFFKPKKNRKVLKIKLQKCQNMAL